MCLHDLLHDILHHQRAGVAKRSACATVCASFLCHTLLPGLWSHTAVVTVSLNACQLPEATCGYMPMWYLTDVDSCSCTTHAQDQQMCPKQTDSRLLAATLSDWRVQELEACCMWVCTALTGACQRHTGALSIRGSGMGSFRFHTWVM